jgi:hypothetical protein
MAAGYNKTFSLAQFPKDFGLWYLASLSTIFQLYHGGHDFSLGRNIPNMTL